MAKSSKPKEQEIDQEIGDAIEHVLKLATYYTLLAKFLYHFKELRAGSITDIKVIGESMDKLKLVIDQEIGLANDRLTMVDVSAAYYHTVVAKLLTMYQMLLSKSTSDTTDRGG